MVVGSVIELFVGSEERVSHIHVFARRHTRKNVVYLRLLVKLVRKRGQFVAVYERG